MTATTPTPVFRAIGLQDAAPHLRIEVWCSGCRLLVAHHDIDVDREEWADAAARYGTAACRAFEDHQRQEHAN